jgi:hypothetical protein
VIEWDAVFENAYHAYWKYFALLLVFKAISCIFLLCLKDQYDIWCFKKFKCMFYCCSSVTFQK